MITPVPPLELPETRIARIIARVIDQEGGYVNDPADRGGETCFGITVARARANGYNGPMRDLPRSFAETVYRREYVTDPSFDKVLAIEPSVAEKLVNAGVNLSPSRATTFLQRALNGLNDTGTRYSTLRLDGSVGAVTLAALRDFARWRGPMGINALLKAINSLQGAYYVGLTESNPAQRRFLFGWLTNRVEM